MTADELNGDEPRNDLSRNAALEAWAKSFGEGMGYVPLPHPELQIPHTEVPAFTTPEVDDFTRSRIAQRINELTAKLDDLEIENDAVPLFVGELDPLKVAAIRGALPILEIEAYIAQVVQCAALARATIATSEEISTAINPSANAQISVLVQQVNANVAHASTHLAARKAEIGGSLGDQDNDFLVQRYQIDLAFAQAMLENLQFWQTLNTFETEMTEFTLWLGTASDALHVAIASSINKTRRRRAFWRGAWIGLITLAPAGFSALVKHALPVLTTFVGAILLAGVLVLVNLRVKRKLRIAAVRDQLAMLRQALGKAATVLEGLKAREAVFNTLRTSRGLAPMKLVPDSLLADIS